MNTHEKQKINSTNPPRFHRWCIRKKLEDGFSESCIYNGRMPMTADEVLKAPSVCEWIGANKLMEIYHPKD